MLLFIYLYFVISKIPKVSTSRPSVGDDGKLYMLDEKRDYNKYHILSEQELLAEERHREQIKSALLSSSSNSGKRYGIRGKTWSARSNSQSPTNYMKDRRYVSQSMNSYSPVRGSMKSSITNTASTQGLLVNTTPSNFMRTSDDQEGILNHSNPGLPPRSNNIRHQSPNQNKSMPMTSRSVDGRFHGNRSHLSASSTPTRNHYHHRYNATTPAPSSSWRNNPQQNKENQSNKNTDNLVHAIIDIEDSRLDVTANKRTLTNSQLKQNLNTTNPSFGGGGMLLLNTLKENYEKNLNVIDTLYDEKRDLESEARTLESKLRYAKKVTTQNNVYQKYNPNNSLSKSANNYDINHQDNVTINPPKDDESGPLSTVMNALKTKHEQNLDVIVKLFEEKKSLESKVNSLKMQLVNIYNPGDDATGRMTSLSLSPSRYVSPKISRGEGVDRGKEWGSSSPVQRTYHMGGIHAPGQSATPDGRGRERGSNTMDRTEGVEGGRDRGRPPAGSGGRYGVSQSVDRTEGVGGGVRATRSLSSTNQSVRQRQFTVSPRLQADQERCSMYNSK